MNATSSSGSLAAAGAVIAALLSSACCWLPFLLVALGASAVGVGSFFEAYRFWFLSGTFGLLGVAFYFVYFKTPKCAPGELCKAPDRRFSKLNRIMLWIATGFALTFAIFPNYFGELVSASSPPAQTAGTTKVVLHVEGMSCASCASGLKAALMKVPGVVGAEISYEEKRAVVQITTAKQAALIAAVVSLGYSATPTESQKK